MPLAAQLASPLATLPATPAQAELPAIRRTAARWCWQLGNWLAWGSSAVNWWWRGPRGAAPCRRRPAIGSLMKPPLPALNPPRGRRAQPGGAGLAGRLQRLPGPLWAGCQPLAARLVPGAICSWGSAATAASCRSWPAAPACGQSTTCPWSSTWRVWWAVRCRPAGPRPPCGPRRWPPAPMCCASGSLGACSMSRPPRPARCTGAWKRKPPPPEKRWPPPEPRCCYSRAVWWRRFFTAAAVASVPKTVERSGTSNCPIWSACPI